MTSSGRDLARLLRKSQSDDPWHGPSIEDLLRGIDARAAAAHPLGAAHSIWELVLHIAAWQGEVLHRLEGHPPGVPVQGDWPTPRGTSATAWRTARASLADSTRRLSERVERASPAELRARVGRSSRPLGTGVTKAEMLFGLLQHNAYHGGQIALLRKALGL